MEGPATGCQRRLTTASGRALKPVREHVGHRQEGVSGYPVVHLMQSDAGAIERLRFAVGRSAGLFAIYDAECRFPQRTGILRSAIC